MTLTSRSEATVRSAAQNVSWRVSSAAVAVPSSAHFIPESRKWPSPPRNRKSVTPRTAMAAVSSPTRCGPSASSRPTARCSSSGTSTSPSSPAVQVTKVTWAPSATYLAMVVPLPIVSSSGWACTNRIRRSGDVMPASLLSRADTEYHAYYRQGMPLAIDTDFGGDPLGAVHHEDQLFDGADFVEATTEGATFTNCVFRQVRFNASTHTSSTFTNCQFRSCSFFDATFAGCKLLGSTFQDCTFDLLTVDGGDWSFVSLVRAPLAGSTFTGVRMSEADLASATCAGRT